jgi:hypothetical protein
MLVKISAMLGPAPLGDRFEVIFRGAPPNNPTQSAWRRFERERPEEHPMCWTVSV